MGWVEKVNNRQRQPDKLLWKEERLKKAAKRKLQKQNEKKVGWACRSGFAKKSKQRKKERQLVHRRKGKRKRYKKG